MKSNLFLFTGFGFLGLNLAKYFKYKNFNISLIGKKKKYPFNIRFKTKHINLIYSDIFNLKKVNDLKIENSIIVLTTLNNNNKDFFVKFKRFINLLVKKKPRKIILISSVGVYGNYSSNKISILNQYSKNCILAENICKKKFKNIFVLRVGNLFGILRPKPGLVEKISMQFLKIKYYKFYKVDTIRSYLPINELSSVIEKIILKNKNSQTCNLTNNNFIFSTQDVLNLFCKYYKKKAFLLRNNKESDIKFSSIKNSKYLQKLKYKKNKNFRYEISKIENFLKNNLIKKKIYYI